MMAVTPERAIRARLARWADFALGIFIVFTAALVGGGTGAALVLLLRGATQ